MLVGSIGAEAEKWQAIPAQNPVRRFGTILLQNRTISGRRHRPEPAKRPAFNTHHSGAVIAPALYPIQHWTDGKAEWDTYAIRKGRVGSHSALPIFAPQSTCPARLISASRPDTPTTMMMGLSGRHLIKSTRLQRIADMTGLEEALLILACAVLSLGWGYYCVRCPALAPLSALRARVLGWVMLALGLLLLYSGTQSIVEALL
jgi:hypothetical protein